MTQRTWQEKICILGFGAQGRATARNLRRSGIAFELGLRPDGPSFKLAQKEGFKVRPLEEACSDAKVIFFLLPDHVQAEIYQKYVKAFSPPYLVFAHGFSTHFQYIPLEPKGPKHILIAPKGAASGLEQYYGTENALPCILGFRSYHENLEPSEKSWIEEMAQAIGCHSKALIWADFRDETECDLFAEQALLCGGVSSLLRKTYEVLTEAGYNPETAYFETLYELKLIVDLLWKQGITGMRAKISPTARYGDVTRGERIIDERVKENMEKVLAEIQNGEFAEEFLKKGDEPQVKELEKKQAQHPIEIVGQRLRNQLFKPEK